MPGNLADPVWVDDESFDISYHVRRSALPTPGTEAQLRELVGRIMSRSLDRTRPLWELYLVEGLEGGRFALLGKTHHAMIDSSEAVDIAQVILDIESDHLESVKDEWTPLREPTAVELMVNAVTDLVRSPAERLLSTFALASRMSISRCSHLANTSWASSAWHGHMRRTY